MLMLDKAKRTGMKNVMDGKSPTAAESKETDFEPKQESMDAANELMKINKIYLEIGDISTTIKDFFDA